MFRPIIVVVVVYIVSHADDELLYLDPHVCQAYEDFEISDESYHCPYKCRMHLRHLDPSIALVGHKST